MIDFHFFPSPNTWKVAIMLEECGLPYRLVPVDITADAQFAPEFLRISPNNRVPAIVDHTAPDGSQPVFESGAILLYLAEKTGRFLSPSGPARVAAQEWLMWQMGGLGPMAGQAHHFRRYAPAGNDYAVDRYTRECARLYRVLDARLAGRSWIADDYSVADMACWGWVWFHRLHGQDLGDFPQIGRWFTAMSARPAVQRAQALGHDLVSPAFARVLQQPAYDEDPLFAADTTRVK
ncbi:glutathione S-transferase N-terminal domain-containing protein [Novosphingobium cyanobacteriorum]|uniref:Glutathione S-transferase N-terminal domain-containing protein n=1 Tax=Novosphingobium cyanobacteriorum TaxID=3024215 RepID=A0ABT6CDM6_9SPHN|nr:glutathione S-transferase N-terminal domain-containing protein [Novosphingobium cyanobacteriorum]MDF8332039.1 glutathione S-transferase N-terminal domain-containing protein [Novosphingobium cyanobacteriorum]